MEQLKLTKKELKIIGFKKCKSKGDEMNSPVIFYKIETINGYFYYNPKQDKYTWYHKTVIGDIANEVHLSITQIPVLISILSSFKVKLKIFIN